MTEERFEGMAFLGSPDLLPMPWEILAPHEAQAQRNHGQSLSQLAARGGLRPCEMLAILEDRPWRPMDACEVIERLGDIVAAANARADHG